MAPRGKASSLSAPACPMRRPQGNTAWLGLDAGLRQLLARSRLSFRALTRRSSGADCTRLSASGQKPSPSWAFSGSASHCGRLWRCGSISSSGRTASQASTQSFSCAESAPESRAGQSPEWPAPLTRALT
jgi:hypothetical protein